MVIALIGEFCNKWLFSIFDSIVSLYGADRPRRLHLQAASLPCLDT